MHRISRVPLPISAMAFAVLASGIASTARADANGLPLCTDTGTQVFPAIGPDASGGAIVAWNDSRTIALGVCYAQRVNATGAPQWTLNGVQLSTTGDQGPPALASDGAGGAYVVYAGMSSAPRIQWVNAA